jgi:hypothetical protein
LPLCRRPAHSRRICAASPFSGTPQHTNTIATGAADGPQRPSVVVFSRGIFAAGDEWRNGFALSSVMQAYTFGVEHHPPRPPHILKIFRLFSPTNDGPLCSGELIFHHGPPQSCHPRWRLHAVARKDKESMVGGCVLCQPANQPINAGRNALVFSSCFGVEQPDRCRTRRHRDERRTGHYSAESNRGNEKSPSARQGRDH